ncbi:MAG: BolA family transcriptional regulator [Myxococcales bacterium]|nr:BolA family transcriptional regulator [Myxococcales bacterium]
MMEPEQVRALLIQAFPEADVQVDDMTGTRDHFDARIVSEAFTGKSRIEQHQLVYAALGDAIHGPIHALKLKTYTPEAWAKIKG